MKRRLEAVLVSVGCVLGCAGPGSSDTVGSGPLPRSGPWHAWLDAPGGDLPFGLELTGDKEPPAAILVNGGERIELPRLFRDGEEVVIPIDQYDAGLRGMTNADGTRIDGTWWRRLGNDHFARLPFHAEYGERKRFPDVADAGPDSDVLSGTWQVEWDRRESRSVALFEAGGDGSVLGTFVNATGDLRFLQGGYDGTVLRLSRFDGAHAFLFHARRLSDGTLEGRFWEGDYLEDSWVAWRDDNAAVPDPFGQFQWSGPIRLDDVPVYDLTGARRALGEPEFAGRGVILEILGTWCPNCHDATLVLDDLYERYHDAGLSVVGVAFEMTDDLQRNAEYLTRYRRMYEVSYPMVLAWDDRPVSPSEMFDGVEGMFAFPTVLFLHGDGRIRAIHTGFTGPATGDTFVALRAKFEALARELIATQ